MAIVERERDERIQKLYDENRQVYSISKVNTIQNCLYEAYKTYIEEDRGKNGIYGLLGSKIHDILEGIMVGENTKHDLLPALNSELSDMEMLNINFPKDFNGGDAIKDNWVADMSHFCKNFIKPSGKFTTEELVIYKINEDRYMQGYIDLIKHNKDGTISIYDWKSSTDFKKADLLQHGRQLVFYGLAKEAEGFDVKEVAWIMLKYVKVEFMGKARSNSKKETKLTKIFNRGKLVSGLETHIENDLYKLGYGEIDSDIILSNAIANNDMGLLPQEIQDKYIIKPYVRKYEITEELKKETLDYINKTANIFESLGEDENKWKPRSFTKVNKSGNEREDTFFCNVLCNHRDTCKHIKKFNDLKMINKIDEDDLF